MPINTTLTNMGSKQMLEPYATVV